MKKGKRPPLSLRELHTFVLLKRGRKIELQESPLTVSLSLLVSEGAIDSPLGALLGKRDVYAKAEYIKSQIKGHESLLSGSKPVSRTRSPRKPGSASKAVIESGAGYAVKLSYKGDVASDAFLQSFEWRALRMQALKLYGRRCVCCGASPETGAVMNVDHIKPRKRYPSLALDIKNLQVLCHECNHGKGNWDMTDWRDKPVELERKDDSLAALMDTEDVELPPWMERH